MMEKSLPQFKGRGCGPLRWYTPQHGNSVGRAFFPPGDHDGRLVAQDEQGGAALHPGGKKQEHPGLSESAGDAGQGCSNQGAENRIICNIMRICFVTHLSHIKRGLSIRQPPLIINKFWCRRPDLNRHGRKPLPPQDSVSTKFHHFGTF